MPRRRKKTQVLVLTEEVPLLLTQQVPVNNHMRSTIVALCLALVVSVLVNIKLEFERERVGVLDGEPVFQYVWIRPWETEPFVFPRNKPTEPYEEHYTVPTPEQPAKKQFLTVWRVIRFGMQIYN